MLLPCWLTSTNLLGSWIKDFGINKNLLLQGASSTVSFSIGGDSTSTVLEKGASSESLNLGPRTAGDGADDEESLTGTVTSVESCMSQKCCEDDAHASSCVLSEKQQPGEEGKYADEENDVVAVVGVKEEVSVSKQDDINKVSFYA